MLLFDISVQTMHRRMNHQSRKIQFSDNYHCTLYSHSAVLTVYAKSSYLQIHLTEHVQIHFLWSFWSQVQPCSWHSYGLYFLCYSFQTQIYSSMQNIRAIVLSGGIGGIVMYYSTNKSINLTTGNNYREMWIPWHRLTVYCQQISAKINQPVPSLKPFCDFYRLND